MIQNAGAMLTPNNSNISGQSIGKEELHIFLGAMLLQVNLGNIPQSASSFNLDHLLIHTLEIGVMDGELFLVDEDRCSSNEEHIHGLLADQESTRMVEVVDNIALDHGEREE